MTEMEMKAGLTRIVRSLRKARIRILRPDEWGPPSEWTYGYDSEKTLVHELVHFHIDRWRGDAEEDGSSADYEAKEYAIDCYATALVNLSRGAPR